MKKKYFITVLILCFTLSSFGQGAEAFTNSGATSSYSDASFVGADEITWSYIHSRNANNDANGSGMTLPALMLRRVSSDSKITSSTVSNGIGDFSVKLYKGFTGGGDRQVELFINGESKGVSSAFDDFEEHVFTVSGINVSGDVIIEIKNSTAKQVIIDDITWTAYSNTSTPAIAITAPTDGATIDATTSVDVTVSVTDFTVGATDAGLDGHIHWTIQENADAAVSQSMKYNTDVETISVTAGNSYTVYMELVDNSHTAISPAVNTTTTFTVAAPVTAPTTDAPTPPERQAGDVISVYSDAYTNINVGNFNPAWGQTGTVDTGYDPTGSGTNTVLEYANFNYQGTEFDATDASAMEFVHIDIWTVEATNVKFSPINNGTGAVELLVNVPVVTGSWSSVDLAIADFTGMTWDSLFQMKFDGAAGVSPSTIYIDNVYFYKEPSTSSDVIFITELADPNDNAAARYVEIYNGGSSTVDLSGWTLRRYTNGNADPQTTGEDLTPIGSLAPGAIAIIAADGAAFEAAFGMTADISAGTGGPADSNGDDQIYITDASDAIVDFFGVAGEDGSGTDHEFEDGRAERKASVTQGVSTWDATEWNIDNDGGAGDGALNVDGGYDPGVWIGSETAGLEDQDLVALNMYPNPANDVLNISVQNTINTVEIFNVLGQKVISMQVENTSAEINVSNLNAGIYLIKYEINNSTSTKKFVKN